MTKSFDANDIKVSGEVYARGGLMQEIKAMMEQKKSSLWFTALKINYLWTTLLHMKVLLLEE